MKKYISLLRKVPLGLAIPAGLFLLFLGLSFSHLYPMMFVNLHIIGFAAIIMGFSIIISILSCFTEHWKNRQRIILLVLKIVIMFILLGSFVYWGTKMHDITRPAFFWQGYADYIRNELHEYSDKNNGLLPDANSWRDLLLTSTNDVNKLEMFYRRQQEDSMPKMAFNKFLSRANVKELDGKIILLFCTDAVGNVSGGQEMLEKCASENQNHIFVLFADGTFGDYDVSKNSLRFLEFGHKQKDYLPLRWKP